MKINPKFTRLVDDALAQPFTGWDFTYVQDRIIETDTSWSYPDLAQTLITSATTMVDLCTGGGELLDQFHQLPDPTYATEGYKPNVSIARQRLEAKGVQVVEVASDDNLPLPNQAFDLVINRHGAYSDKELRRIMQPSGATFFTQQVGSDNAIGLNDVLGAPHADLPDWRLNVALERLTDQGFFVTRNQEEFPSMSFADIGAVVYYLKAIPWQIPEFSVTAYRAELLALHEQIEVNGSFDTQNHRFLIEAKLE